MSDFSASRSAHSATQPRHQQTSTKITPIDRHISMRLKHRRLLKGITQQELAPIARVTYQQIQKYEANINRISTAQLWLLGQALDCPISYFFQDIPPDANAADHVSNEKAPRVTQTETLRLVHYFSSIKEPMVRQQLVGLAHAVAAASAHPVAEESR